MVQLSIISKRSLLTKLILVVLIFLGLPSFSQVADSLITDQNSDVFESNETEIPDSLLIDTFSANIGLGAGNFAFFGDVGKNYGKHNPFVANLGYQLRIRYWIFRVFIQNGFI